MKFKELLKRTDESFPMFHALKVGGMEHARILGTVTRIYPTTQIRERGFVGASRHANQPSRPLRGSLQMKTQDERIRYVIQHKNGWFINVKGERKDDFMSVNRLTEDEAAVFLTGHYAPDNPEEYHVRSVRVTYELMEDEANVNSQSTAEGN